MINLPEPKYKAYNKKTKIMSQPFSLHLMASTARELINFNAEVEGNVDDIVFLPFTGMRDKNGHELYAGDVFDLMGKLFILGWDNDNLCWDLDAGSASEAEYKGNSLEQPELFEEAE